MTYSHLHTALALVRSIRRTWEAPPPIFIALVDHTDQPRPGLVDDPDVVILPASRLGVPNLGWLLCKLSPAEVCCALKPFLVRTLFAAGFETVLYADSDLLFLADAEPFWADLGDADFLVTPHVMSPLPAAEPWTRVTLGQLAHAGVLNAGLFIARKTTAAEAFLATWSGLCVGPGAFLPDLGLQQEQHAFNWIFAFHDNVRLCRDPRVNVAYWNLHERPLRWGGLDGGDAARWYLDGRPIICFHFSGFAWERGRLSSYDERARPAVNANLHALCERYASELARCGRAHYASHPYQFAAVDGIRLDDDLRLALKRAEMKGTPQAAEWTPAVAAAALAALNTGLGGRSLVPGYLTWIQERVDLASLHDPLFAPRWLRWADLALWRDHPLPGQVYEQLCPFVFHRAFVDDLAAAIAAAGDGSSPDGGQASIRERLCRDRPRLIAELRSSTLPAEVLHAVEAASYRVPAFLPTLAIRLLHSESPHLRERFPHPLGSDAAAFADWLRHGLEPLFDCPPSVLAYAQQLDLGRSLARVVGRCLRTPPLIDDLRRQGLLRTHLLPFVGGAQCGWGYSADDLLLADWWLEQPEEEQQTRIREVVPPEAGEAGFADFLRAWLRRRGVVDATTSPPVVEEAVAWIERRSIGPAASPPATLPHLRDPAVATRLRAAFEPRPRGVNVFGYFKTPTGLGAATRGLCRTLAAAGYEHQELMLPSDAMDEDFTLEDLFPNFSFAFPRSFVVTYPHIDYQLQSVRPRCFFAGRETVAYLAWEQRDFPPAWSARLAPYDKLCALSRFSAEAIAGGVGRPVSVLPCAVEVGQPVAKREAREHFGIPAGAFVVGFVFDAASSIERKNPWAVVDAVERAFAAAPDVYLVLKVGSGWRPDFAAALGELRRRATAASRHLLLITDYLPKREVETLLCALDVYLSLHRSEGFGYTLAEAMLLGVPCVASRYSGNLDFMSDANSSLVDCREVVVRTREGPFESGTVWAEPDVDHAAALLRALYDDYPAAAARARAGAVEIADLVSPAAVARTLSALLEGQPARGELAAAAGGAR